MTVWLLLVAATVVSWVFGAEHLLGARSASVAVLVLAFVKARLVGRHFMELRSAPVRLRVAFEGWTVIVCSVLIGLYLSEV